MPQEAEQYLRRHKQELDLLLIGSSNLGVPYIEGVSSQNKSEIIFCDLVDHYLLLDKMYAFILFSKSFIVV